ncbi:MAG: DUF177 domain-containing protein [Bacteroidales bacterium]|nr:DUF177 domain-containing protein [Bacteroidales bacterium]
MSRLKDLYTIPLQTLKEGKYDEILRITKEFIEKQQMDGVYDADLNVNVHFVKQKDLHTLSLKMKGTISVACDRCLDIFQLPIQMDQDMVVKVGEKDDELADAENVIVIAPDETEIGLSPIIYEMIMLSIPLKKVHKNEKDCNSNVVSYLKQKKKKNEEKTDPRWDSLKDMFKK